MYPFLCPLQCVYCYSMDLLEQKITYTIHRFRRGRFCVRLFVTTCLWSRLTRCVHTYATASVTCANATWIFSLKSARHKYVTGVIYIVYDRRSHQIVSCEYSCYSWPMTRGARVCKYHNARCVHLPSLFSDHHRWAMSASPPSSAFFRPNQIGDAIGMVKQRLNGSFHSCLAQLALSILTHCQVGFWVGKFSPVLSCCVVCLEAGGVFKTVWICRKPQNVRITTKTLSIVLPMSEKCGAVLHAPRSTEKWELWKKKKGRRR